MSGFSGKTVKDGIERDIVKKINPTLTSAEKTRIKNEATIFAEAQLAVQRKNEKDEKGETSRVTPAAAAKTAIEKAKEEKPPKLKFPLLLALGAGITAFAAWIADFIGPVAEFVAKTLPKLLKPMGKLAGGFFKAMKGGKLGQVLAGLAKGIGGRLLKFGRFIPVIGSLFSFGFGISRFKKGEYIPAVFEFLSGILNLLPTGLGNVASMIIDGGLLLYDLNRAKREKEGVKPAGGFDMWGKIKNFALNLPGVKNIISMGKGIGAIFAGDFAKAGEHFNEALPFVGGLVSWLAKAGASVKAGAGFVFGKAGDFFGSIKDKFVNIFKSIVNSVVNAIKRFASMFMRVGKGVGAAFKALVPGGESPLEAFQRVVFADAPGDSKTVTASLKSIATDNGIKDVKDQAVASEVSKSNVYLEQLVKIMAVMANNQGNTTAPVVVQTPPNNDMSGSMQGPSYSDARTNFFNSTYSMNPT